MKNLKDCVDVIIDGEHVKLTREMIETAKSFNIKSAKVPIELKEANKALCEELKAKFNGKSVRYINSTDPEFDHDLVIRTFISDSNKKTGKIRLGLSGKARGNPDTIVILIEGPYTVDITDTKFEIICVESNVTRTFTLR